MPVAAVSTALFIPFLAVAAVLAVWGLSVAARRAARSLGEATVRRLIRRKRFPEAARLLSANGRHEEAARLLAANGRRKDAVSLLEARGAFALAARLALEDGDYDLAAGYFQREGDLSAAAGCRLSAGNVDEALVLFRRAGDLITGARLLERHGRHDLALPLYMEAGDAGRVADVALECISDRLQLRDIGRFLEDSGTPAAALAVYRKGACFGDVGRLAEQLGQLDSAIDAYLKHDYFEPAAAIYSRRGQHREAAQCYLKRGLVEKAAAELLQGGDLLSAARLYRRFGKPARAVDVLEAIPPGTRQHRDGMLMACSIFVGNQRYAEAASTLTRLLDAIGYSTDSIEVVYRLVDLQLQLGKLDEAIGSLERAKRAGVSDPRIDEQLMHLRQSPDFLLEPEEEASTTFPVTKTRIRGASTTIGFPRSDRYSLKRKLARGGHGILFLVRDQKVDRDVVLKLLHSETLPSDVARRYFLREARTAAGLEHPNIVRIFDYGELEGRPYIAMEYVDGLNLMELYESLRGDLPNSRLIPICLQLCEALHYAHGRSIIHRDLKMENVMVSSTWQVKLMDFGLAKALDENPDRSLFIIGTPFYMSPEQIVGGNLDNRSDIYSLGVLMFRLFSGRLPFEEGEILSHHRFTPPPDPRTYRPDIDPRLAAAILTCLRKDPNERFASARETARALEHLR